VILLLPLAGIRALRLYENELVRQTESALVSEGAYVREHFRTEFARALEAAEAPIVWDSYGQAALPDGALAERFDPIVADIDLAQEMVHPRAEDARTPTTVADEYARTAAQPFSEMLTRSQRYTLAGIRVVDYHGIVVASSRGELGLSLAHRPEIARALAGERVRILRHRVSDEPAPPLAAISRGNRVRLFVALPIVHQQRVVAAVVLSRTPVELTKALHANRFVLLRYAAALIMLVLLVSWLTATTISRPIRALVAQTDSVEAGGVVEPIRSPGSRELEHLSMSVSQMARALRERAEYIQVFARSVSHELKTPLATTQATVELLRDHLPTMSEEQRDRFLDILSRESVRMQRLVERLLLLARADMASPGAERTNVKCALGDVIDRYLERGLHVAMTGAPEEALVCMARESFELVITNLLENAMQHAGPDAQVEIRVAVEPHGAHATLRLEVCDDGPGISVADSARVFDAFFTSARERGGTGLGLSIAKALVESSGGSIELSGTERRKGLCVRLRVPVAPEALGPSGSSRR
jgi:signal transduction histidine kinase